jgi:serine/threonine protein kinase
LFESLKLSDLSKQHCGVLRKCSRTRPVIWILEENGIMAIVKDFSLNGFVFRNTIGRFLVWREKKAYIRLKGLRGVPTFYRAVDGLALVMEAIPGKSIESPEILAELPEAFFDALQDLVEKIHKRGMAHCDLKRAPNIILGDDGRPYIIDWAASVSKTELGLFPLSLIYDRFIQDDLKAIIKIRLKHSPESVSPAQKRDYFRRGPVERLIRPVKEKARDLLKKIA